MSVAAKIMEADERKVQEQADSARRETIAEQLVERLLHGRYTQMQLFEIERERDRMKFYEEGLERIRAHNPGKLVLDGKLVDEFRYEAAMYGAGFHPSQFDEITWRKNDLAGTNTVSFDAIGGFHVRHEPEKIGRANRMRDEVGEELFTKHVPSTGYDLAHGAYITSEEDLKAIFEFDQANLMGCKWLYDEDLLEEYEEVR